MPFLYVDGHRAHFTDTGGGGSTILIVPGALGSTDSWATVARLLAIRHRVITVDLHGSGLTDPWSGSDLTLDDEAAIVTEVIASRCGEPVALLGHSYGTAVCLRAVLARPAYVSKLVLVEPLVLGALDGELRQAARAGFDAFAVALDSGEPERAVREWFAAYMPLAWTELSPATRAKILAAVDTIRHGNRAMVADPTTPADYARIGVPSLVVSGGATRPVFRGVADVVSSLLRVVRHDTIEGGTHIVQDEQPAELASRVTAFVAPAAASARAPRELRSDAPLAVYAHDPIAGPRLLGNTRGGALVPIPAGALWFVRHGDHELGPAQLPALVAELVTREVRGICFAGNAHVTDRALAVLAPLAARLEYLGLGATAVSEAGLGPLALAGLRAVDLAGTAVTPGVIDWLSTLPALEHLNLGWTAVDDAALARLVAPRLRSLDLTATRIGDGTIATLAKLPALEVLQLAQVPVTDAGIAELRHAATLRYADLSYTRITDAVLPALHHVETVSVRATAVGRATAATSKLLW